MNNVALTVDQERFEELQRDMQEFNKRFEERKRELKRLNKETTTHIENIKRLQQQRWGIQHPQ